MTYYWKQRIDRATTSCVVDVVSQMDVVDVGVQWVQVMREESLGSRARADSNELWRISLISAWYRTQK